MYKTEENDHWTRLNEPTSSLHFNINKMIFSEGVKLSQWNKNQAGICEAEFQVTSAEVSFENTNNENLFVVQCEGLSVAYCSHNSTLDDKAPGIETAKLFHWQDYVGI